MAPFSLVQSLISNISRGILYHWVGIVLTKLVFFFLIFFCLITALSKEADLRIFNSYPSVSSNIADPENETSSEFNQQHQM